MLSALTETGQEESTIPVLKQRSYSGDKPVISSALSDTPCVDLGVDGVLEKLNEALGTSYTLGYYTLGSKILHFLGIVQLHTILEPYVTRNDDFGTVYAHLRHFWYHCDVRTIQRTLRTQEEEDRKMRRKMLGHDRITRQEVPPRRVWDLYANRVVPYIFARERPQAISHAWVEEKDRENVMTPINGYKWPVPMPKDANLDLIRIEMLNHGAEYAWLDVLCLRQEGGKGDHLRLEEWKLDVPTIGYMYTRGHVVCYFSGLGRPLHLTLHDLESDRCWFRGAWPLQEIADAPIIGWKTMDVSLDKEVQSRIDEQLSSLRDMQQRGLTFEILSEMKNQVSTKPLDKVAGLVYPLQTYSIPIYDAEQLEADAWETLMDVMLSTCRADFLFHYPEPGNGRKCWRPSWEQVITDKIIAPLDWYNLVNKVEVMEDTDADIYEGYRIESGYVRGLSEVQQGLNCRQGELVLKNIIGELHTIQIVANHAYPIPDGVYTLLYCLYEIIASYSKKLWVVGRLQEDGKFEKLSVFHSADIEMDVDPIFGNRVYTSLC